MESLKEKTAKGLFWGALNNVMLQLIGVTMGIVMGRLLNATDYGMIAMISIFALVANDLQNSGFKAALNNIKQPQHRDYNSVFWFNIAMGGGLYVLLFFLAPLIASYYHTPQLIPLCRYAFLSLIFSSFGTAQSAYLAKNIMAKQVAKANLTGTFVSSSVAVWMAWSGYGYWAFATQTNLYVLINTLLYWHYSHWRPTFSIDWQPVRHMFKFSSKLLFSSILTDINNNIMNLLLGHYYSASSTGAYNQAYQWHSKAFFLLQGMLTQVAQPVLVDVGNERERQLRILRKMMRLAALLSFPLLFGLGMVAHEFITVAITAKWARSAEYMQLLCIGGAFVPLSFLLSNLVISKGRSSVYLYVNLGLGVTQVAAMLSLYQVDDMRLGYAQHHLLWRLGTVRPPIGRLQTSLIGSRHDAFRPRRPRCYGLNMVRHPNHHPLALAAWRAHCRCRPDISRHHEVGQRGCVQRNGGLC